MVIWHPVSCELEESARHYVLAEQACDGHHHDATELGPVRTSLISAATFECLGECRWEYLGQTFATEAAALEAWQTVRAAAC